MQTLDIECPSCGEMLELDAGFAGGVCRCSNCGTLMTVPSDAGKAESLTRPSSSASVGSGGLSSMGVPDPGERRSDRSGTKRSKGKKSKASQRKRVSTTIEAGEYRTASGKVIRLDESTRVPMAEGKRKKIRAATAVVFFAIVATVVAIAVVGIIAIMGQPGGPGGGGGGAMAFDPAKNPYTLEFANVMGIPVSDRTVVIVEASEYSEEWAEVAGDMLGAGLSQKSKGSEVALVGAGDKLILFAGGPPRKLPISAGEVRTWFGKLPTTGEGDVAAAITKALEWEPQTLIVMHGYTEMSSIEAWNALVKGKEGLEVHTVHIGDSSAELEGWAGEYGGAAAVWSVQEIESLKDMAGAGGDE